MEMVHRFYDEYYFRPKAIFRIVKRAAFNSTDRKRLYTEAKSFHEAARRAQSLGKGDAQAADSARRHRRHSGPSAGAGTAASPKTAETVSA